MDVDDLDRTYDLLKRTGRNNVDEMVKIMREAGIHDGSNVQEARVRSYFSDVPDKSDVSLDKFKQAVALAAADDQLCPQTHQPGYPASARQASLQQPDIPTQPVYSSPAGYPPPAYPQHVSFSPQSDIPSSGNPAQAGVPPQPGFPSQPNENPSQGGFPPQPTFPLPPADAHTPQAGFLPPPGYPPDYTQQPGYSHQVLHSRLADFGKRIWSQAQPILASAVVGAATSALVSGVQSISPPKQPPTPDGNQVTDNRGNSPAASGLPSSSPVVETGTDGATSQNAIKAATDDATSKSTEGATSRNATVVTSDDAEEGSSEEPVSEYTISEGVTSESEITETSAGENAVYIVKHKRQLY